MTDTPEQTFERERTETEAHVKGVEEASGKGLLTRRMAERVIGAGQKANRSHDMARGLSNKNEAE